MDAEPTVGDVMRRDVPVVTPDHSVAVVARIMAESGLPGVPVLDGEEIVGIVTESDIIAREANVDVPSVVPFLDAIFVADGGRDFDDDLRHVLATTAGDLMTSPVYNILASATLTQLATLMVDERVNPVPVLNEDRSLVGIVSRSDLVRVIARLERDSDNWDTPGE
ncbi:MAG: CBS domain-containing protein [Chloroflexota bacterium]|nr:CBS domain-containing protein [Chloroflexota bacterium]MDP9473466.1 CBS domain-containing protein [Chloroflexota bacterium]